MKYLHESNLPEGDPGWFDEWVKQSLDATNAAFKYSRDFYNKRHSLGMHELANGHTTAAKLHGRALDLHRHGIRAAARYGNETALATHDEHIEPSESMQKHHLNQRFDPGYFDEDV